MGRKDAARFIALEKRIKMLEMNQDRMIQDIDKINKKWQLSLITLREVYNKLIESYL